MALSLWNSQPHGRSCISVLFYGLWGYGAFWPRGGGKGGVNISQSEWEGSLMPFNGLILHPLHFFRNVLKNKGKLLLFCHPMTEGSQHSAKKASLLQHLKKSSKQQLMSFQNITDCICSPCEIFGHVQSHVFHCGQRGDFL